MANSKQNLTKSKPKPKPKQKPRQPILRNINQEKKLIPRRIPPKKKNINRNLNKNKPSSNIKQNFQNTSFDTSNIFGNSKLIIGETSYLLNDYKWFILVILLLISINFSTHVFTSLRDKIFNVLFFLT